MIDESDNAQALVSGLLPCQLIQPATFDFVISHEINDF